MEVQEKQPAPFTGLLFPLDKAAEAREAIIQRDAMRITNGDQKQKIEALSSRSDTERLAYFLIGVAVSGVSFYVIESFAHRL